MTTPSYLLNLSPATIVSRGSTQRIELSIHAPTPWCLANDFLTRAESISRTGEIPTSEDPIVLYILAHGVPNGVWSKRRVVDEKKLAQEIIQRRQNALTLLLWDVCFAKSFLEIPGLPSCWTKSYVHVFCCEDYERTWHHGAATRPGGQTLFSKELREALGALGGRLSSWTALEKQLQMQFGALQRPTVHPKKTAVRPNQFDLA